MSADAPGRVLVIGGSSEIAGAILAVLPRDPARRIVLAGRESPALNTAVERARGLAPGGVHTVWLDAEDPPSHRAALTRAFELLDGVDLAILAVGVLGERGGLPEDIPAAVQALRVNVVGAGSLLLETARLLRRQGTGTIVVLSSVAAERPRATNAVYCASKAGLDALARGLGDALMKDGVRMLVVRPGFVRTRMTQGLPAPPLATTPAVVAAQTLRGLRTGAGTVWAPRGMRWVMAALRLMPRSLFRRIPA